MLTGVDYTKVEELFKQMSTSLKKFFGQQATSSKEMIDVSGIKVESACLATEDVNYFRNRSGRNSGYRGNCEGYRGRGNYSGRTSINSYRGSDNWERGNLSDKTKGTNSNTVNNLSILMGLMVNLFVVLVVILLDI